MEALNMHVSVESDLPTCLLILSKYLPLCKMFHSIIDVIFQFYKWSLGIVFGIVFVLTEQKGIKMPKVKAFRINLLIVSMAINLTNLYSVWMHFLKIFLLLYKYLQSNVFSQECFLQLQSFMLSSQSSGNYGHVILFQKIFGYIYYIPIKFVIGQHGVFWDPVQLRGCLECLWKGLDLRMNTR